MEKDLSSDELFAIQLQAEFDREYHQSRQTEDTDRKLALKYAAAHNISDSESDPDFHQTEATVSKDSVHVEHPLSDSDGTDVDIHSNELRHRESTSSAGQEKAETSDKSTKSDSSQNLLPENSRPLCEYGSKCYRKNPEHLRRFKHPNPNDSDNDTDTPSSKRLKIKENETGFYLTKVTGIPATFNRDSLALNIKDILSPTMGNIISSAQFNYMFDIPWLMDQYPQESRSKPLLLIHGEKQESKQALTRDALPYKNISLCQAPLDIMFGTHHTKMMFLLYDQGLRIVIHTANLISNDWNQKTQGIWLSPVFPKLNGPPSVLNGESETFFKKDILEYLMAYKVKALSEWCEIIKQHDLASARVYLIGSVPGRHVGERKMMFGHMKLRKVLRDAGPDSTRVGKTWPVIGQFSSIGSLGANPNQWLAGEWLSSLSTTKKSASLSITPKLQLVFPSVDNVRRSLEGYPAGASLPYGNNVATKQKWLEAYFHQWKSELYGRSFASPHIKTYLRVSPDFSRVAWILLTSANLSKAAWGALEKKETQFAIRSYELGVLFVPRVFEKSEFGVSDMDVTIPFDIPPTPYGKHDEPWVWDIPHVDLPDRNGNAWQPS